MRIDRVGDGIISRTVYPAGKRVTGKERGEWMKLTDDEAALIRRMRESRDALKDRA